MHKIDAIVKGNYPILHVCGEADNVVPVDENTRIFEQKVKKAGGQIKVIYKTGVNHHPHSLQNPTPIVDFILKATNDYEAVLKDELHKAFVVVDSLEVSTVSMKIYFWINSEDYGKKALQIKSEVVKNVKDAILAHGLNLPANIQEIKLYGTQQSIPISITKAPDSLK